ncbi:MAG: hypothetical protein U1F68_12310 [Gammaproteobacteria bacterium]
MSATSGDSRYDLKTSSTASIWLCLSRACCSANQPGDRLARTRALPLAEQAQLILPPDAGDFGSSIALDGDVAAIGAPLDDTQILTNPSCAYVFTRSGVIWSPPVELKASDEEAGDTFGNAVVIQGGTIVVGAQRENSDDGAAYVFVNSGGGWMQQQKLVASIRVVSNFGAAVAVACNTAVIGAPERYRPRVLYPRHIAAPLPVAV